MWRTGVRLSVLALATQLVQLVLQLALARLYGTGAEVDALVAAVTGPQLLSAFLVATGGQLLIPALVREKEAGGERAYAEARNALLLALALLGGGGAFFFALARAQVLGFLVPGLNPEAEALARRFLLWSAAALVPGTLAAYLGQTHNARESYLAPALAGLAQAGVVLGGFLSFHEKHGVEALLVFQFLGAGLSLLALGASEFFTAPGFVFSLSHPQVFRTLKLSTPLALTALSTQVNLAVDRFFASYLESGSLAVLHYADRWLVFTQAVLSVPLINVFYTRMARAHARSGGLGEAGREAFSGALYLGVPLSLFSFFAAPDLAAVLLSHGSGGDAVRLAACVRAYAGVLAAAGFGSVLVRAFYVRGETLAVALLAGVLPMIFNAALDFALVRSFGIVGLASVTSLNALIGLPLTAWVLHRRNRGVFDRVFFASLARALGGALGLWPLWWALQKTLAATGGADAFVRLALFAVSGAALYLALTRLLGSEEAREILSQRRAAAEGA